MFKVAIQFWDLSYRCFTFNREVLTLTIKEYLVLVGLELHYQDKVHVKKSKPIFRKKFGKYHGNQGRDY